MSAAPITTPVSQAGALRPAHPLQEPGGQPSSRIHHAPTLAAPPSHPNIPAGPCPILTQPIVDQSAAPQQLNQHPPSAGHHKAAVPPISVTGPAIAAAAPVPPAIASGPPANNTPGASIGGGQPLGGHMGPACPRASSSLPTDLSHLSLQLAQLARSNVALSPAVSLTAFIM